MTTQRTPSGSAQPHAPATARRAKVLLATWATVASLVALPPLATFSAPAFGAEDPAPAKTLAELRAAAQSGEPQALLDLADELAFGESMTDESLAESATWYRRAAEKGNVDGQHQLALMLWNGEGVEKNEIEAVQWFRRAAEQGKATSQYWLATAYEFGDGGVTADPAEAAKWYRRAADQGHASSQSNLGQLYAEGRGVPKDLAEAVRWLKLAVEQKNASGEYALAEMYAEGKGVSKNDEEATKLYERAANGDFPVAMSALGEAFEQGRGVRKNPVCALFWYGLSAERGYEDAEAKREALAAKLSPADRAEGERLLAGTEIADGEVLHPVCPGEPITVTLTNALLGEFYRSMERVTGLKVEADEKTAALGFSLTAENVPWETALTRALESNGLDWVREGETIRIVPKPKKP